MTSTAHLLIADDEPVFLDATADLLRREGYTVSTAATSAEAVRLLQQGGIDLLIADINMPGNPQLELIAQLNASPTPLPVILVTGHPSATTAIQALHLAVARYLIKPFEFADLLAHIRYLMQRAELHRALRASQDQLAARLAALAPATALEPEVAPTLQRILRDIRTLDALLLTPQPPLATADARSSTLEQAILETILTLEKTKRSFKSRELRLLREKLQAVIDMQPPPPPGQP